PTPATGAPRSHPARHRPSHCRSTPGPLEIARNRSCPSLLRPPALAPADAVALPYPPPKRSGATRLPAPDGSPTPPQQMEIFDGMVQPIFPSTGSGTCGNSPSEEASLRVLGCLLRSTTARVQATATASSTYSLQRAWFLG
ncbi:unnamed protein product, partial [Urochloa humidicola]